MGLEHPVRAMREYKQERRGEQRSRRGEIGICWATVLLSFVFVVAEKQEGNRRYCATTLAVWQGC